MAPANSRDPARAGAVNGLLEERAGASLASGSSTPAKPTDLVAAAPAATCCAACCCRFCRNCAMRSSRDSLDLAAPAGSLPGVRRPPRLGVAPGADAYREGPVFSLLADRRVFFAGLCKASAPPPATNAAESVETGGALFRGVRPPAPAPAVADRLAAVVDATFGMRLTPPLAPREPRDGLPPTLPALLPPHDEPEVLSASPHPALASCSRSSLISVSFCASIASTSLPPTHAPMPGAAAAAAAAADTLAYSLCASWSLSWRCLTSACMTEARRSSSRFSSRTASSSRSFSLSFTSASASAPPLRLAGPSSTLRTRAAKWSEHAVSVASEVQGDAQTNMSVLLSPPSESCSK